MKVLDDIITKLTAIEQSMDDMMSEVFAENAQLVIDQIQDQLWMGKDGEGNDITPSYLTDPYFKSSESARRYMNWKESITPNSQRNAEAPNLYITGVFYDSMTLSIGNTAAKLDSTWSRGDSIINKYSNETFVPNAEFMHEVMKTKIITKFREKIL